MPHPEDRYNLQRFIDAQSGCYEQAMTELRAGKKRSHWMWFIFPQIAGLGKSATAQFYSISTTGEARAYLIHPVLGDRLLSCVQQVNAIEGQNAHDIFGSPDDLKFRSCLTLFAAVAEKDSVFAKAIAKYYPNGADPRTLALMNI